MLWLSAEALRGYRSRGSRKPFVTFTVSPESGEGTLLGKSVRDLQSGITFNDNGVYGTLYKVTGFTGFSGDVNEQSGHYLAFRVDTDDEDDEITVELLGGNLGHPVTLDSDRNIIIRVGDPRRQKLRIIVSHTDTSDNVLTETRLLNMADLIISENAAPTT